MQARIEERADFLELPEFRILHDPFPGLEKNGWPEAGTVIELLVEPPLWTVTQQSPIARESVLPLYRSTTMWHSCHRHPETTRMPAVPDITSGWPILGLVICLPVARISHAVRVLTKEEGLKGIAICQSSYWDRPRRTAQETQNSPRIRVGAHLAEPYYANY